MSSQEVAEIKSDFSQTEEDDSLVVMELRKKLNAHTLMAYIAVSDRNAMAEQLKGLKHLNNAVVESQEMLHREKERATNLQVALWRNEAFITRNKLQMKLMEDRLEACKDEVEEWKTKYKKLQSQAPPLRDSGEKKDFRDMSDDIPDPHLMEKVPVSTPLVGVKEMVAGDTRASQLQSKESDTRTEEIPDGIEETPGQERKPRLYDERMILGVSREIHEIVVQENIHLKNTLKQILEKERTSLKRLTDSIEYEEIIKQLKRRINDLEEELTRLKDALNTANKPREETARKLLDMGEKLNEVQKADRMKQILIQALSNRSEELRRALELSKSKERSMMSLAKSTFLDQNSSGASAGPSDQGEKVQEVLPSIEIQHLTKENMKLKKLHQHQAVENETLRRERDSAKREINDLHRKVDSLNHIANLSFQADHQCLQCRDYKTDLEKTKRELASTQQAHEVAVAQSKYYESDFKELSQSMEQLKKTNRTEIDVWKRNCHSLSAQTEQFKKELEKQTTVIGQLRAQTDWYQQELHKMRTVGRSSYSPDTPASSSYVPMRCSPGSNPWQESTDFASMPSEVAVGGHDQCDLATPQRDSSGSRRSSTRSGGSRLARSLECIRCHRVFPMNQQHEFEEHQRRCLDSS